MTRPILPATLRRARRSRPGFCALFLAYAGLLSWGFSRWSEPFGPAYLYPLSWAAGRLLTLAGVAAALDTSPLPAGYCVLTMERSLFHVTWECTGIFALFVYLAAVLAHPAPAARRARAALLGVPALFAYGVARLVALGLIGHLAPAWTPFCHVYLLVFMNVGFVLYLWSTCVGDAATGRVEGRR